MLLELYRYGQSHDNSEELHFHPCRQQKTKRNLSLYDVLVDEGQASYRAFLDKILSERDRQTFDQECFLRIISYSQSISNCKFQEFVGRFLYSSDLRYTDLHNADLHNVNLRGADLRGANLTGADLSHANLIDATLISTYLTGADLSNANFSGANLSRAYVRRAYLRSTNLSRTSLDYAYFSGTDLRNANLSSADLSGTDLRGAYLRDANFNGTDLSGANLGGANLDNIVWDELTIWEGVKGIENAVNVPEALKQQLGL